MALESSYTVQEACRITGASRRTIYREIEAGRLPTRRVGPRMMILARDLDEYAGARPATMHPLAREFFNAAAAAGFNDHYIVAHSRCGYGSIKHWREGGEPILSWFEKAIRVIGAQLRVRQIARPDARLGVAAVPDYQWRKSAHWGVQFALFNAAKRNIARESLIAISGVCKRKLRELENGRWPAIGELERLLRPLGFVLEIRSKAPAAPMFQVACSTGMTKRGLRKRGFEDVVPLDRIGSLVKQLPIQAPAPNGRVSKITVPQGCHPLATFVFAEMKRQAITYDQLQERSGILRSTFKAWRTHNKPGLETIELALAALGYRLAVSPVDESEARPGTIGGSSLPRPAAMEAH